MSPRAIQGEIDLRPVATGDLTAVAAIYNHYVLHSTCTFAEQPEPEAYWDTWFAAHSGANAGAHPGIVAVQGDEVVGWGTLSRWNVRCAYRYSVEDSVYVKAGCHRRGIGRVILQRLIAMARHHGHRSLIAQIADHQAASEVLHEQLGFRQAGTLQGVGFKFNRWIDVAIWQLQIAGGES